MGAPDYVATAAAFQELRDLSVRLRRDTARRDVLVQNLRASGASWSMVGLALGISRQAARQRYGTGELFGQRVRG